MSVWAWIILIVLAAAIVMGVAAIFLTRSRQTEQLQEGFKLEPKDEGERITDQP